MATWKRRSTGCAPRASPPPPRRPAAPPPRAWWALPSKAPKAQWSRSTRKPTSSPRTSSSRISSAAPLALQANGDVEALKSAAYPTGGTVEEKLTDNIATIGENQSLRRTAVLEVSQGAVVSYVHNAVATGMGKIGVLVALEGAASAETLQTLGKQIAMHIAAANPLALNAEDLDPALLERERAIAIEKAKESGKPDNIVEKMVEGSMAKFRKENALLSQLFVIDNKTPVGDVVAQAGKDAGSPITLKAFMRFQLGEGIEKAESDFAAEVAAAAGVKKDEPVA